MTGFHNKSKQNYRILISTELLSFFVSELQSRFFQPWVETAKCEIGEEAYHVVYLEPRKKISVEPAGNHRFFDYRIDCMHHLWEFWFKTLIPLFNSVAIRFEINAKEGVEISVSPNRTIPLQVHIPRLDKRVELPLDLVLDIARIQHYNDTCKEIEIAYDAKILLKGCPGQYVGGLLVKDCDCIEQVWKALSLEALYSSKMTGVQSFAEVEYPDFSQAMHILRCHNHIKK